MIATLRAEAQDLDEENTKLRTERDRLRSQIQRIVGIIENEENARHPNHLIMNLVKDIARAALKGEGK